MEACDSIRSISSPILTLTNNKTDNVRPAVLHKSTAEDEYGGYRIPVHSIVIGNVWSVIPACLLISHLTVDLEGQCSTTRKHTLSQTDSTLPASSAPTDNSTPMCQAPASHSGLVGGFVLVATSPRTHCGCRSPRFWPRSRLRSPLIRMGASLSLVESISLGSLCTWTSEDAFVLFVVDGLDSAGTLRRSMHRSSLAVHLLQS